MSDELKIKVGVAPPRVRARDSAYQSFFLAMEESIGEWVSADLKTIKDARRMWQVVHYAKRKNRFPDYQVDLCTRRNTIFARLIPCWDAKMAKP